MLAARSGSQRIHSRAKVGPAASGVADAHRDALRDMMARCEELADALDAGRGDLVRLRRAVALLRAAFTLHCTFDDPVRTALSAGHPPGDHHPIGMRSSAGATDAVRDVVAMVRAHLDGEEACYPQGQARATTRK